MTNAASMTSPGVRKSCSTMPGVPGTVVHPSGSSSRTVAERGAAFATTRARTSIGTAAGSPGDPPSPPAPPSPPTGTMLTPGARETERTGSVSTRRVTEP